MQNVVIIGNSGAARECYWLLRDMGQEPAFKGFLAFEGYPGNLRELAEFDLGSDDDYTPARNDVFAIGIGLPALRLKAYHKWKGRGANFVTLRHPDVVLVGKVSMGEGNILACGTHISCDAVLGHANYLNGHMLIGHDVRIGDGNFFGPYAVVQGGAVIGSGNSFGVHSAVLAGAKIGDNNTMAPGACVYKGCGNGRVLAGNPALDMDG
ncbi:MAG: transferase [Desulfovibrio sp.]|jgi:acetyltransferase-like isoleucine patch superfamily enzyme|nr:transferase [Desulfovibrio sp.]